MFSLLLAVIYAAFISLGLPDALLGSAWPTMYRVMNVPVSYAGIVSMIISCGTVISSLMSDRAVRRLGTHLVTVISVGLTALGLFGFSSAGAFWQLCVWAVPYGLGAGSVDAALNNYIALYYRSGHMNWLHCFWGLGAMAGPYIMGACLTGGYSFGAASMASLFYIGITAGRFLSGFISDKLGDRRMVSIGIVCVLFGTVLLFVPVEFSAVAGLVFIGLGCAPVYPGLLHQTPVRFGAENAQAVMGMQMACAYVGSMTMPAFFGKLSDLLGMQIYPVILMAFAALLAFAVWNANRLTLDRK